jgi:hypothetical protein
MTDALKRARELVERWASQISTGSPGELWQLDEPLAAALDAWAQEARLEEAKWWMAHKYSYGIVRKERLAALEQRTGEAKEGR